MENKLSTILEAHYDCERCGKPISSTAVCRCTDKKYSEEELQQEITKARIDELEKLKSLHKRIYRQTVTDNRGNVYTDESNSYISIYETEERIAKLSQTLKDKDS